MAALALVFLIFAITAVYLGRIASSYAMVTMRHNQASALLLAEAGVQKAAERLIADNAYTGEKGTKLTTGYFDVSVAQGNGNYIVTSTGYADSPFDRKPKMRVQAEVRISGGAFRIVKWRQNP